MSPPAIPPCIPSSVLEEYLGVNYAEHFKVELSNCSKLGDRCWRCPHYTYSARTIGPSTSVKREIPLDVSTESTVARIYGDLRV